MAGMTSSGVPVSVLLSCYLDGELSNDELAEVVAILESDVDAIAEFRRLKEGRAALRTLPAISMPPSLLPGAHLGEELSAYLDGELVTMEMPAVMEHLASCAECRDELAELDRSRTAVRALPGVEPPAFLEVRRNASPHRRRIWPAAAAVGGIAAAALAFSLSASSAGSEPVSIDVADLQTRHSAVASVPAGASGFEVSNR
jgi:anti-sigma factor RsiW